MLLSAYSDTFSLSLSEAGTTDLSLSDSLIEENFLVAAGCADVYSIVPYNLDD